MRCIWARCARQSLSLAARRRARSHSASGSPTPSYSQLRMELCPSRVRKQCERQHGCSFSWLSDVLRAGRPVCICRTCASLPATAAGCCTLTWSASTSTAIWPTHACLHWYRRYGKCSCRIRKWWRKGSPAEAFGEAAMAAGAAVRCVSRPPIFARSLSTARCSRPHSPCSKDKSSLTRPRPRKVRGSTPCGMRKQRGPAATSDSLGFPACVRMCDCCTCRSVEWRGNGGVRRMQPIVPGAQARRHAALRRANRAMHRARKGEHSVEDTKCQGMLCNGACAWCISSWLDSLWLYVHQSRVPTLLPLLA